MQKDYLRILGVVVVLGALLAYMRFANEAPRLEYKPVELEFASITVEDQPEFDVVVLDAELSAPGWITIHFSMSGAPAEVVGTSDYLEAGTYDDLAIQLSQDMLPGWTYIALLHIDNGDQSFDINEDLPVSVNGEVVRPDFLAGTEEDVNTVF